MVNKKKRMRDCMGREGEVAYAGQTRDMDIL